MRVLVCGGRDYAKCSFVWDTLDNLEEIPSIVISGGASGADNFAMLWALRNNIPHEEYKADWNNHGKQAGFIRNKLMLDKGKPDMVIAFPGGRGTSDMVSRSIEAGVHTEVINE